MYLFIFRKRGREGGTEREGRKLGLKSMVWMRRKKETSNQKRMKKQEFKKK